jgi:type II secretory pathway pseudopilin PulG
MHKKGQIQLSFGMIFSVIIIAIVLFVAVYVLMNFIKTRDCVQLGTFNQNLVNEIQRAYNSQGQSLTFQGSLPAKITSVCFGNLEGPSAQVDKSKQQYFKARSMTSKNLFFYPSLESCSNNINAYLLEHIQLSEFFCISSSAGKVELRISKEPLEAFVELSK